MSVMVRCVTGVLVLVLNALQLIVPPAASAQPNPDDVQEVTSAAGFKHPGVFVTLDELKLSKARVKAKDAPWVTIYKQMATSTYATRGAPRFTNFASAADGTRACSDQDPAGCVTYCGPNNSPNIGCSAELADAWAVYAQSLLWWYTNDPTYAHRAIAILNAYAQHFKGHTGTNGPLMAAWVAEIMLRGAEIIRYTYIPGPNDPTFDIAGFSRMLDKAFAEKLTTFNFDNSVGNWTLSAADGMINLAVFLDDRSLYDRAVQMWRERVPAYIYLKSDGVRPVAPSRSRYQDPTELSCWWLHYKAASCKTRPPTDPRAVFANGQTQETCRDFNHTSAGLAGIINTAETAWIQGDDLYGEQQQRIMTGVSYATQISLSLREHGWPPDFCNRVSPLSRDVSLAGLPADVVYNAYEIRKGVRFSTVTIPGYNVKYTNGDPLAAYIAARRTTSNPVNGVNAWETLTHHFAGPRRSSSSSPSPSTTAAPSSPATPTALPSSASAEPASASPTVGGGDQNGPGASSGFRLVLAIGLGLFVLALGVSIGLAIGFWARSRHGKS